MADNDKNNSQIKNPVTGAIVFGLGGAAVTAIGAALNVLISYADWLFDIPVHSYQLYFVIYLYLSLMSFRYFKRFDFFVPEFEKDTY